MKRIVACIAALMTVCCILLACNLVAIHKDMSDEYTAIEDLERLVRIFGKKDGTIPVDTPDGTYSHGWKVMALVLQDLVDHGYSECNGRIMEYNETWWLTNPRAGGNDYVAIELMNGDLIFFLKPYENQNNIQERLEEKADELNKEVGVVKGNHGIINYAVIADSSELYTDLIWFYCTGGYPDEYRGEGAQKHTLEEIWAKYE